jgi:hypothetical protein
MTTDLEQRLRDALREDADRARLVNPSGPPAPRVPPLIVERRPSRGLRWVAVAAVVALIALVGALTMLDDDQSVDTVPPVTRLPAPNTIVSGSGCPFGISGDPVVMQPGPVDPAGPRFDTEPGQGVAHASIGSQVVEVRVPGFVLQEPNGWRMEDVELARGPAKVWLDGPPSGQGNQPFVQVRFFPGSAEPCSSFTVTVDGGSEAENRQTAVDFAERIVLPAELEPGLPGAEGVGIAALELADTEWTFVDTSDGPVDSDMVFSADTVTWDTGCERLGAGYELDRDDGFLILTNVENLSGTCGPPTTSGMTPHYPVIDAVMRAGRVPIRLEDGRLYLGDHPDGDYVVLGSRFASGEDSADPLALPEPGEQPADPAAAEDQVRAAYLTIADTTIPAEERAPLSERPEVWLAAAHEVTLGPNWELIQEIEERVDAVVFVSPTRAVLRFQLIAPGVPRDHIGEALLVDGRWVMAVATSCELFSLAGVTCDMSL